MEGAHDPAFGELPLNELLYECRKQDATRAFSILSDVSAHGVLFSDALRSRIPAAQRRREAFRRLILHDQSLVPDPPQILGNFVSGELASRLNDLLEKGGSATGAGSWRGQVVGDIVKMLGTFIKEHWYLVEPAQIITYKRVQRTRDEAEVNEALRAELNVLLERTDIFRYS